MIEFSPKTIKKLKILFYLFILIFLGFSTYFLMGDAKERPIQIGFGLVYIYYALFSIYKRIRFLDKNKIPKIKLNKMKRDFNFFGKLFYIFFPIYSSCIFLLAINGVVNHFLSSIWLLCFIFVFQGICFLYLVNYIGKHKPQTLIKTFSGLYVVLSILMGWTSAQICFNILKLPIREDLFFATYGLLILPVIFILYFNYVFDYSIKVKKD